MSTFTIGNGTTTFNNDDKRSIFPQNTHISVTDPTWELLDPTPDLHAMFLQFNDRFFQGALAGCEVRWSPKMTTCAGVCCYEGHGGLCSIRLSRPLLTLRSRKDLVETLLHEMIHAYLFVKERNRDHEGHGPQFKAHMFRINKEAGSNITVYHSFHAEVANFKTHWWRCQGRCRDKSPFFGWIKRASNRAPGKNDFWWANHQKTCGGVFVKVKQPEGYENGRKKNRRTNVKTIGIADFGNGHTNKQMPSFFPGIGHILGDGQPAVLPPKKTIQRVPVETVIHSPISNTNNNNNNNNNNDNDNNTALVSCPVCNGDFFSMDINMHLDLCLARNSGLVPA